MKNFQFIISIIALFALAGCAAIDRNERRTLAQHNVSPAVCDRMVRGEVLSISDIIELSRRQIPPSMIVHYLYSTRAIYSLDKQSLARLNQAKVRQEVLDYLLDTPSLFAPRPYVGGYDGYPYYGYYPYQPYPYYYGPSAVVVVGGRWHHHR